MRITSSVHGGLRRHLLAVLVPLVLLAPAVAFSADSVVATVPVGANPVAISVDPVTHHAFVANYYGDSVSVIDGVSDAVDATVRMPTGGSIAVPISVVTDALNGRTYVGNFWSNFVSAIDGSDFSVVGTIAAPPSHASGVRALALDPSGAVPKVYAAVYGIDTVSVIDCSANAIVSNIPVGDAPRALAVFASASRRRVFVANRYSNDVTVIDGDTDLVVASVPVGAAPKVVAVDPDRGFAYVSSPTSDTVTVIDDSDHATATVVVGDNPIGIGVDAARRRAFVANYYGNSVSVIDADTLSVVATVPTGAQPYAVAIDESAGKAFVSCYGAGSVTVIDAALSAVTVPVGTRPYALAVDEGLAVHKTFVGNWGSNSVSVIDPATSGSSPVTVTIDPMSGDTTASLSPSIGGLAASLRSPYGSAVVAVFYRLDGETVWRRAAIVERGGTSSVRWEIASLGPLAEGAHSLEVAEMDQAMAVASSSDQGAAGTSAALGSPAVYAFTVSTAPPQPPVTTLEILPASPDGENGWYRGSPLITLAADRPVPTYYAWDDGPMTLYSGPFSAPTGARVLSYRSGDDRSGVEETKTCSLLVDPVIPYGPVISDVTHAAGAWEDTGAVVVGLSGAGDADSGLAGFSAVWSSSPAAVPDGSVTISPLASSLASELPEGAWYVAVRAKDAAGNLGDVVRRGPYLVDLTPPETSDDALETYRDSAVVHLSAADPLSGVAATAFSLDGSEWTTGTAVSAGLGTHTLRYRSTDAAGNGEPEHSVTFSVLARYEQNDPLIVRIRRWSTILGEEYSGGSCIRTNKRGARIQAAFVGTRASWISPTGPAFGVARVVVDGSAELVDLRSPTSGSNVWTCSGLPFGEHTLTIEWTGLCGTHAWIGFDALDVDGVLVRPPAPYLQYAPCPG